MTTRGLLVRRLAMTLCFGVLLALGGCASPPYVTDTALRDRATTTDPQEIARRFGDLSVIGDPAKALGWTKDGGGGVITGRWVVPGVHLTVSHLGCGGSGGAYFCNRSNWDWYYDPETKALFWHCEVKDVDQSCKQSWYSASVQPDGSLKVVPTSIVADPEYTIRQDRANNRLIVGKGVWVIVRRDSAEKVAAGWQEQARSYKREKDREDSEFWGNVAQATLSAAQTFAAERGSAPPAPAFAPPPPAMTSSTSSSSTVRPASTQATSATVQRPPQQVARSAPAPKAEGPKRRPYPEAVVVCTIPSGPLGKFVCENPVNKVSGTKDIHPSDWRTPESMVRSFRASCRDARPLPSSTHLVWGCGFAATNKIVGYYDRAGPGVDVRDRQTFYCYEGEQGCRRTSP